MDNGLIIELPIISPSLNKFYANKNPFWRSQIVKKIKRDVQYILLSQNIRQGSYPFSDNPVGIIAIICFADNRHRDVDNYFPKPIIDALKGFVIINDDDRYVASCEVRIKLNCKENKTVLVIKKR